MISRTPLTARDYLEMAGIKNMKNAGKPVPTDASPRFSELLDEMRSSTQADAGASAPGLTIRDYFKNPVPARVSVNAKYTVSTAGIRATVPPLEKKTVAPKPVADLSETPGLDRTREKIAHSIQAASDKYQLPAALIRGVVRAESNFQVAAVSRVGAQGLMQLMPGTAKELGVTDPFDIQQNIDGGSRYLRQMMDRFDGDVKLALAAYNAGPGTVQKYNGNVPYAETRNYVQKVLRFQKEYSV